MPLACFSIRTVWKGKQVVLISEGSDLPKKNSSWYKQANDGIRKWPLFAILGRSKQLRQESPMDSQNTILRSWWGNLKWRDHWNWVNSLSIIKSQKVKCFLMGGEMISTEWPLGKKKKNKVCKFNQALNLNSLEITAC